MRPTVLLARVFRQPWANAPGFAPDPSFSNNLGITGFKNDSNVLTVILNNPLGIRFTWAGKGDSTLSNSFQVNSGSGFQTLWGPAGTPVAYPPSGPTSYDIVLPAGPIAFRWVTGNNVVVANGTSNNPATEPHFFAGIDPYLATGTFQTSGNGIYLGLSDLPATGDHDFQDLGVYMAAVPEPATVAMIGMVMAGAAGYWGVTRRRRRRATKRAAVQA